MARSEYWGRHEFHHGAHRWATVVAPVGLSPDDHVSQCDACDLIRVIERPVDGFSPFRFLAFFESDGQVVGRWIHRSELSAEDAARTISAADRRAMRALGHKH
ncbi:MAG: hypothetical protein KGK34_07305 [Chloroflexota bacterium]|nr:hypothetical protein [Chloroflexota bacterium]